MPTGGVTVESAGDFIRAGAVAIGLGSWLFAGGATSVGGTRHPSGRGRRRGSGERAGGR